MEKELKKQMKKAHDGLNDLFNMTSVQVGEDYEDSEEALDKVAQYVTKV